MNKTVFYTLITLLCVLVACKTEQDPFEIGKQHSGLLTDSTQVKDLKMVFSNDSVVKRIGGDEFIGNKNDIEIYDTTGKKLLVLTPSTKQRRTFQRLVRLKT